MGTVITSPAPTPVANKDAVARRHRNLVIRRTFEQIGVRIFLVLMSLVFLSPLYWMLVTALKPTDELSVFPPTLWPLDIQWVNFVTAYNFIPFATYLLNSIIIAGVSMIGTVISNLIVAYGFACLNWPGRDKVFYLIIATLFLPFPIAVIPLFDMFAWLGWVDTLLPLTVPHFFATSFYVFMIRQFLLQIPKELLEAARIDGAGELQILWRVAFPMALPVLAVVAIFTLVASWKDFLGPLVYIQNDALRPLSTGLQYFRSIHTQDVQFNLLMAASVMTILPLIILFFAFQRYFIRGVTIGSIR